MNADENCDYCIFEHTVIKVFERGIFQGTNLRSACLYDYLFFCSSIELNTVLPHLGTMAGILSGL